jgi:Terminase large subunit, T4likevirus-type, N-terminal
VSLASLLKEWDRALADRQTSLQSDIPAHPAAFAISLGIYPDPWQTEVLASDHPRKILPCARRAGKTTVAAVLAIHKALTQPGAEVLILAPTEDQAKIAYSQAARLYRKAGAPHGALSDRRTGLELRNGSTIEARTALERSTRGRGADLLIFDEASRIFEQDYLGVLPTLAASGGDQILLSTPNGRRGFFHDIWHDTGDDWERTRVVASDVPHRYPMGLEFFRRRMPLEYFQQEFECAWLDTEGGLFSYDDIEAALAAGEDVEAVQIGDDEW